MENINQVFGVESDELLTSKQAAKFIGCAEITLNMSRCKGMLFGVPAPSYIKRGYHVFYKRSTLKNFNAQFKEFKNTSEATLA